jgi:hypothetical protein
MIFIFEFFRIRGSDNAHATLDRITHIASDLESAKVSQVIFRHVGPAADPRWFTDFG